LRERIESRLVGFISPTLIVVQASCLLAWGMQAGRLHHKKWDDQDLQVAIAIAIPYGCGRS